MTKVKICGINNEEHALVCVESGADFIGLVFYPSSPRAVSIKQAREIALSMQALPKSCRAPKLVGLFVGAPEAEIVRVLESVPLDILQLHGQETPQAVESIKKRFSLPVIKALPVGHAHDLSAAAAYEDVVDWLLFDARYNEAVAPGGHGRVFDWSPLKEFKSARPFMLAGGLHAGNAAKALSIVRPQGLDVSSGVEESRGIKSADKIREFIACVRESV